MITIKVAYRSTVRRFSVPDTITWDNVVQKLYTLFSISSNTPLFLSYTDEDGDEITLSSNFELEEVLQDKDGHTLSFRLTAPEDELNGNRSWVLEGRQGSNGTLASDTSSLVDFAEDELPVQNERTPLLQPQPVNEDSSKPDIAFQTTFPNQEEGENDEENERPRIIDIAERFQGLVNGFQDVLHSNPQLVETANHMMDQILNSVPVDLDGWAGWMSGFRASEEHQNVESAGPEPQFTYPPNGPPQPPPHGHPPPPPHHRHPPPGYPGGRHPPHWHRHPPFPFILARFIIKRVFFAIIAIMFFFMLLKWVFSLVIPALVIALVFRLFKRCEGRGRWHGRHGRHGGWWRRHHMRGPNEWGRHFWW